MISTFVTRAAAIGALFLGLMAPQGAAALTFAFSGGPLDAGTTFSGRFSGTDLNGDGLLWTDTNEITAFSLTLVSGNAAYGDATAGLDDLDALLFDIDGRGVFDSTTGNILAVSFDASFAPLLSIGGPNSPCSAFQGAPSCITLTRVTEESFPASFSTGDPITSTQVPLPASAPMLLSALGLGALLVRRRAA